MKKTKQIKKKEQNFAWSFVIVCLLLAGAVLLNMVSSRGRGVVGKSNNLKITIDTAAWVTYTDKSLGITFKHPVNAFINGAGPGTEASNAVIYKGSIIQYTPLNYSYYSDFSKYYDNRNLQDVAELFYKTNIEDDNSNIPTNRFISRPEKISLAGAEAFQMNIDSGVKYPSGTNYHIDGRHKLTFLGLGDKKIVIDSKAGDFVAEEILKSFKFLDRQDLKNDWQIYRNEEGGYTIMRPESWKLKNYIKSDLIKVGTNNLIDNYLVLDQNNITDLGPGYLGQIVIEKSKLDLKEIEKSLPAHISKNVLINGLSAKRFEYQTGEDSMDGNKVVIQYVLVHNGVTYRIIYTGSISKENEDVFEKIVASFKFDRYKISIDASQVTVNNYSFSIPDSWKLEEKPGYIEFKDGEMAVASLICPIMETGYEAHNFVTKDRIYIKNGEKYHIEMWGGTAINKNDPDMKIIFMNPGDSLKAWSTKENYYLSCQINTKGIISKETGEAFNSIFNMLK